MPTTPERLRAQLAELGVTVDVGPIVQDLEVVTLTRGAFQATYRLVVGDHTRLTATAQGKGDVPTLVVRPFVSPRTAEALRRTGVQYLDYAGNAWVEFGDVLIDVQGRPRPAEVSQSAPVTGNLFSRGRMQVIFALLAWPELWDKPQRDLAHTAGVSLGQAHNTLGLLAEAGYHAEGPRRGQTTLLDVWAAAFPTGLARQLTLRTYRGEVDTFKPTQDRGRSLDLRGASGRRDLRPASMTLYVVELDPRLAIVNRWRSDGEPNIVVRRKFWNSPDDASSSGAHTSALAAGLRGPAWPVATPCPGRRDRVEGPP